MHLLQTAKCGQNAQAATRLALEGTRVVYDPAASPRETVELEEDSQGCLLHPRVLFRPSLPKIDLPLQRESPLPPRSFDSSALSANTLRYQSTDIYRHAIPNDC